MKKLMVGICQSGLILITLFLPDFSAAQDLKKSSFESQFYNNAIYGSVGVALESVGDIWFTGTAYYERLFQGNVQKSNFSTFVKGGFGVAAYWEDASPYILGQFGILTGRKKSHFEVSAGFLASLDKEFDLFPVSGSMGYRFQKPGGHFIFRTGVGYPEALYFSLGASF